MIHKKNFFDIIIIGGGLIGLISAITLAKKKFSIAIIEKNIISKKTIIKTPKNYTITSTTKKFLKYIDIWKTLKKNPFKKIYIYDSVGKSSITFDSKTIQLPQLGYVISDYNIRITLLKKAFQFQNIFFFPLNTINNIKNTNTGINVSNQKNTWIGKLLLITDGKNSVAKKILNIPTISWPYTQNAITAIILTEKSHRYIAYQKTSINESLAILPLKNKKISSIIWSLPCNASKEIMFFKEQEFTSKLQKLLNNKLGKIILKSKRHIFPIKIHNTKQYSGNKWILLGDAAHTIHPITGMGFNIGIYDILIWINCLKKFNNNLSSKKALQLYNCKRKKHVWETIFITEILKFILYNPKKSIIKLRSLGLKLLKNIIPIKNKIIKNANGEKYLKFL
ncbi:FAD-dependent monooxygenase [Candidatus Legionella polyplacis]|uniref:FAD-dependent monooxygenase n=1 Tax=Candidatus Legionella polyplacis TaxID=2005262 RepID=A0ABZ2GYL0_9GAMM